MKSLIGKVEINQLERYEKQKEIELLKVDNVIGSLTDREKIIIEMRYFKKYNNRMVVILNSSFLLYSFNSVCEQVNVISTFCKNTMNYLLLQPIK